MMQELAIARVLSVALASHYAFVAISLAMCGIGLAGLLVFLFPRTFSAKGVDDQVVAYVWRFGVAAALSDFAFLHFHVVQALSWTGFATLTAAYVVLAVPFLCEGAGPDPVGNRTRHLCDPAIDALAAAARRATGTESNALWQKVYERIEAAAAAVPLVNRREEIGRAHV